MSKFNTVKFVLGAQKAQQLPKVELPEIAFVGRSNTGKSSLINVLLQQKQLARVAKTPGRTAQINYFLINNEFYLCDLPGYGYSKTSKKISSSWRELINAYIQRKNIKLIILLHDVRRDPTDMDWDLWMYLRQDYNLRVAFTKIDKLNTNELNKRKQFLSTLFNKNLNTINEQQYYLSNLNMDVMLLNKLQDEILELVST